MSLGAYYVFPVCRRLWFPPLDFQFTYKPQELAIEKFITYLPELLHVGWIMHIVCIFFAEPFNNIEKQQ